MGVDVPPQLCLRGFAIGAINGKIDGSPCRAPHFTDFDQPTRTADNHMPAFSVARAGNQLPAFRDSQIRGGVDRVTGDWRRMRDDFLAGRGKSSDAANVASGVNVPPSNGGIVENKSMSKAATSTIRGASDQRQKPCRVVVLAHGRIIYATPTRHSRPDLHKEIVSFQRRWLQKKYPDMKNMQDVVYKLQWLEANEWVFDRQ